MEREDDTFVDVPYLSVATQTGETTSKESNETLESLGDDLKAIASANGAKLAIIEEHKEEMVVCGFYYDIKRELPANQTFKIEGTPGKADVGERVAEWTYVGAPLAEADDVFNDNINYQLRNYDDVKRLNQTLLKVGSKYCDLLSDRPKTREGVRMFIGNMKTLAAAIDQIIELTKDAEDMISQSDAIKRAVEEIDSGSRKLRSELGFGMQIRFEYKNDTRTKKLKTNSETRKQYNSGLYY